MNKKNQLIAILNCHDDDVYCFRKEVIEEIKNNGYDLLLSNPYGEKIDLMKDIEFKFIDTYIDRRGTNIIKDFKLLIFYYKMFKKYKPDLVLTYTAKPNIYGSLAAKKLKIPYLNNITGLGSVLKKNIILKKFIFFLFKTAFKNSECLYFQNKENLELAKKEKIIKGDNKLIPGSGVNVDKFALKPYPKEEKIIFNYIGRVLKEKGIDNYINAAEIIKQKYPNTEFNIIGFIEPTEKKYSNLIKELEQKDIIKYRGSQKNVIPFIERSHCTIHPSIYGEGMSNVLLESSSTGRPVITTNISGCKEIVEDKINGYIYEAGNTEQLIKKIETFINLKKSEKEQMGKNGRKKVEKDFNRKFVVEEYMKKIEEVLSGTKKGDSHEQ